MDTLSRFRVYLTVRGGISRPPYSGHVDTCAEDEDQAFERAVAELKRTSFKDLRYDFNDSFRLDRVERIG